MYTVIKSIHKRKTTAGFTIIIIIIIRQPSLILILLLHTFGRVKSIHDLRLRIPVYKTLREHSYHSLPYLYFNAFYLPFS